MFRPSMSELLIIFAVLILLFGPKKLPELGKAIGASIRNFKNGINNDSQGKEETAKLAHGKKDDDSGQAAT